MNARVTLLEGLAVALFAVRVHAEPPSAEQREQAVPPASERQSNGGATGSAQAAPSWRFAGAAYFYFLPESSNYVQPTLRADHHLLHLEARYSYEDLLTGSAWIGVNAEGGEVVWWQVTPLLGGAFGRTNGVAFGFEGALGWWKLELYSEGEYLLDFADSSDNFLFNWSEFTLAPLEWFRFGVMAQRTRIFSSGRVLERGLLAGASWHFVDLTLHLLNPDDSRPVVIVALGGRFEL